MNIRLAKKEHTRYLRTNYCCVRNYKDNNCTSQYCRKYNVCSEVQFMYYSKSQSMIIFHYVFCNNENIIERITNIISHEFIHELALKIHELKLFDNTKFFNCDIAYNLANYENYISTS